MEAANQSAIAEFLPYIVAINVLVGLAVAYAIWAFRSGRWVEEQTRAHDELQRQITALATVLAEIKTSLVREHEQRREFIDRITEVTGKMAQTLARHDERIKAAESRKE